MSHDDRKEFEAARRESAERMRADEHLRSLAHELYRDADAHDWPYQWSWLGLPVIQMPPDIVALQEAIWAARPQLVIETGVARGGSLVLSATVLEILGEGEVLGIDVDIRAHNRAAIEAHPLARRITLLEGDSLGEAVTGEARSRAETVERVMVILDSDHSHDHVLGELRAYGPLVTPGQYLVVADTALEEHPAPAHRARSWGTGNSPGSALRAWLAERDDFEVDEFLDAKLLVTASPGGYLRRRA